ncbi:MAG: TlpA disulfide reductase family protein [Prolixibacteraceae bacterium]
MKNLLALVFVFVQMAAFAQENNFTLKGKIEGLNAPAKLYLRYAANGKNNRDSVMVTDGTFLFQGNIKNPVAASLQLMHEGYKPGQRTGYDPFQFFIEPGTILINSKDSIKLATIKGSKINDENALLKATQKPLDELRAQMQALYKTATPESVKDSAFRAKASKLSSEFTALQKQISLKFIKENPDSWFCFDQFRSISGYQPDPNVMEPLFNGLSERLKNTEAGKAYAANLIKWRTIAIGMTAPEFTQNDPDGKPVKLSDFRGKYLLLDFWASWCGPCRAENPHVVEAYNKFKDKNFTILSVSLDKEDAREAWLAAIKKDGMPWNHVSDLKFWENDAAVLYTIQAIPDNFLLSPEGKIIARGLRGDALANKLAELLK